MTGSTRLLTITAALGLGTAVLAGAVLAQPQAGVQSGIVFRNVITGEAMDTHEGKPGGRDTQAVKTFFQTGQNIYIDDKSCLRNGESLFLTSCSGCHGHLAEGKVGPASTTIIGPIRPIRKMSACSRPCGAVPTA